MKKKNQFSKLTFLPIGAASLTPLLFTVADTLKIFESFEKGLGVETLVLIVSAISFLLFSILLMVLFRNFKRGKIFESENFRVIVFFSFAFIILAASCLLLATFFNLSIDTSKYSMLIVTGIVLSALAAALNMGVKMKEEQDLTI